MPAGAIARVCPSGCDPSKPDPPGRSPKERRRASGLTQQEVQPTLNQHVQWTPSADRLYFKKLARVKIWQGWTAVGFRKPTVYLDTSIVSSYWYEGTDVLALGRRVTTREWWDTERSYFTIWASSVTEEELEAGKYPRQREALAMARRLRFLPLLASVREFAQQLVAAHVVPD